MACELTAALWLRQEGWELGARGQGHSERRDKLKEPLEKQPGPTITTTPQQELQSFSRVTWDKKGKKHYYCYMPTGIRNPCITVRIHKHPKE